MKAPVTNCENHALDVVLRDVEIRSVGSGCLALVQALERLATGHSSTVDPVDISVRSILDRPEGVWAVSDAYWRLRTAASGITSGVVFTPPTLTDLVIADLTDCLPVVDLGAGTGMLSIAAARLGFQVTAVERDPEMARVLSYLARIEGVDDQIRVVNDDAFNYSTSMPSQIMSNPPYTRHHSLSTCEKEDLHRLSEMLGVPLRRTAGHYAYFMLYAWKAKWSQHEVLLIPTNWLETRYGEPLRSYLISEKDYALSHVRNGDDSSAFHHALTTSCILTTRDKKESSLTPIHPTARLPRSDTITAGSKNVERASIVDGHSNGRPNQAGVRLGDILRVKRGIATGANDLFVITREEQLSSQIPMDELIGIIRKLRDYDDEKAINFLWVPAPEPSGPSFERIRFGESESYHTRALCLARDPWWRIAVPESPTYLISYMGRQSARILKNRRGLLNLNNVHGIDPADGVPEAVADAVANWLTSADGQGAILRVARRYQGGLWKVEPGDMHRVEVPFSLKCDSRGAELGDLV